MHDSIIVSIVDKFVERAKEAFLSGPPPMQNWSPNGILGTPTVEAQNGAINPPLTCLGLEVPNLEILRIGDLPDISTNSIMPFHNHASILVHRLSQGQHNWPRGLIFVE